MAELADGGTLQLPAGGTVPAVEVTVKNGNRKAVTKALLGGQQQTLEVTLRLWRVRAAGADAPAAGSRRGNKCDAVVRRWHAWQINAVIAILQENLAEPDALSELCAALDSQEAEEGQAGEGGGGRQGEHDRGRQRRGLVRGQSHRSVRRARRDER